MNEELCRSRSVLSAERKQKETKCTLLSSVTNRYNTFAVNSNTNTRNLKINEISIFVAFCVFLLSLSFNFYLVNHFKPAVRHFSALWLCKTNAVVK